MDKDGINYVLAEYKAPEAGKKPISPRLISILRGLQRKWQIWIPDFRSWSQG